MGPFSTVELSRLLRVCRHWRNVITHDRTLWKVVDLEGRKDFRADALRTMLARSGTLEVELRGVHFEVGDNSTSRVPYPEEGDVKVHKTLLERTVTVIASHMPRICVLELSIHDTRTTRARDLSPFDPILMKPAPLLRDVSLVYSNTAGHVCVPVGLFRDAVVTPNLHTARFKGCFLPDHIARDSIFALLETLHVEGRASEWPLQLQALTPTLKTLHLSGGPGLTDSDRCNLAVRGSVNLVLHDYETPKHVMNQLALIDVQRLRSVHASGVALGIILDRVEGNGTLSFAKRSRIELVLSEGPTCTFDRVTSAEVLEAVSNSSPAREIFRAAKRVLVSAEALDVFPPGSIDTQALFTRVEEVEITDLTDTSLLQRSGLLALILTNAPRVILRAAEATELTWETCLRVFSVLGLRDKPRFPERLDLYNIELKQPRWVLENGDPDERWFFLRVRMYDAQDNLIRRRSLAG